MLIEPIDERKFYIKNIGPFELFGIDIVSTIYSCSNGYYEKLDGTNMGPSITQRIHRFDEEGNLLPSSQWQWEQLEKEYVWVIKDKRIKIEV